MDSALGKGCFFYRFHLAVDAEGYLKSHAGAESGWSAAPFLVIDNQGNVIDQNRSIPLHCLGEESQWPDRIHQGPWNYYYRTSKSGRTGFFVFVETEELLIFGRD